MSNSKRSSIRIDRRPARYGDSVSGLNKKNGNRKRDKENIQENKKEDDGSIQGDRSVNGEAKNKGHKSMFVGDLNGDDFPVLQTQVNTSPTTDVAVTIGNDLNAQLNDTIVNEPNIASNSNNADSTNEDVSVFQNANCVSDEPCNKSNTCTSKNEPERGNTSTLVDLLKNTNHDNSLQMIATEINENGGRLGFARVLVELNAEKQFKDVIEIVYKRKDASTSMTKYVQVEYAWKPDRCSHCSVFGHEDSKCRMIPKEAENMKQNDAQNDMNDGFQKVTYRRGRDETYHGKNKKNGHKDTNDLPKSVAYPNRMNGQKQNSNKQEYRTKKSAEVVVKPSMVKGKGVDKETGSSSTNTGTNKVNTDDSTSGGCYQTNVGIIGKNRYSSLDSLVNEEEFRPNIQERKQVEKVLETNGDPTVNEWENWNEDMKKKSAEE
ncbi:ATPase, F1/V1/A1 complex, alpha/beta subunit, Zinc knuckle CX2CX4HX4C [Artemisia annua]|uniref:ATPase, F1/V1/A1 complex, alpha/beta subunit, Zinc knuckle CX2CX4HX4C n=1 Tax=Artemisia annua TaxID=35608 RepID=A0A2U1PE99_ARTAN|nr:ATPase, F1/V1/A1 complex, alpha/beta subunit, Zinc knuckle CX2CX4HX4C [Artemisia annua]